MCRQCSSCIQHENFPQTLLQAHLMGPPAAAWLPRPAAAVPYSAALALSSACQCFWKASAAASTSTLLVIMRP